MVEHLISTILLGLMVIVAFGLLVFVHELGHFVTAKAVGMKVDEFAIGFGPKLVSYKWGETLYSIRIIPLGGFNKIAGMHPEEEGGQDEGAFCSKPVWARMIVIAAGSFMNLLLPVLLFFIVFLSSGVAMPSNLPVIGEIMKDKPAAAAGLLKGDTIIAANGQKIETWPQFVEIIQGSADSKVALDIKRADSSEIKKITVIPDFDESVKKGIIGVVPHFEIYKPGVLESLWLAGKHTYTIIDRMLIALKDILIGKAEADLAGPVGIMKMTGDAAQSGIIPLIQFTAFLSLNLGIINLFPIPMLDGGHIIFLALEAVRRKPLSKRYLEAIHTVGFAFLMIILIVATFKDFSR